MATDHLPVPAVAPGGAARKMSDAVSIRLKTSLLVPHLHEGCYSLPTAVVTVADLLGTVGRQANVRLIGEDGELDRHFDVRLNGKRIDFHPARLATQLSPNDSLVIALIPIGGG